MATFYAQTESAGTDDDLHDVAGSDVGEVPTVTALHAALGERVRIPDAILRQLVDHTPRSRTCPRTGHSSCTSPPAKPSAKHSPPNQPPPTSGSPHPDVRQ